MCVCFCRFYLSTSGRRFWRLFQKKRQKGSLLIPQMIAPMLLLPVNLWLLLRTMRMQMLLWSGTRKLIDSFMSCPGFRIRIIKTALWVFFLCGIANCSYLIKGILPNGLFFVGYTYAGELPSCAFGFNSHGLVKIPNSPTIYAWVEWEEKITVSNKLCSLFFS